MLPMAAGEAFEEAFPGRMSGKNDDTDRSDPAGFLLPGFSFYGKIVHSEEELFDNAIDFL